jgi:hypothetical protein
MREALELTGLRIDLLSTQDNLWERILERCAHDIYHLPGYCRVSAREDGGLAQAMLVQRGADGLIIPFVRRELPGGLWDGTSPYGYCGPVWTSSVNRDHLDDMFRTALRSLQEDGCVSLFVRMHPGINGQWPELPTQPTTRSGSSETVCIDLTRSDREIWSDTASGHRNEINRAGRRGYSVVVDHEAVHLYDFARLYRANMAALGARSYYYFDDKYFQDIYRTLGSNLSLIAVMHEGNLVGGALFTSCGDWLQYHLSASDPSHRAASPAKLVIDARRRWGQQQGYRWLHLGGGRGGAADSLFRFKAGFSSLRLTFRTAGFILRSRDYADLMLEKRVIDGAQSYFPAYRGQPMGGQTG